MVFPSPTLARNVFGSNAAFLLFFTKKSSSPDEATITGNRGSTRANHTAIPTPEIDILAGVTLTHFALCGMRQRSGWRLTEDVPTRIEQFRMACRTYQACVQRFFKSLGNLLIQVMEERFARLVIHLGLEFMSVLERHSALCRRSFADFVDQPLQFGNFIQVFSPSTVGIRRAQPHASMSTIV